MKENKLTSSELEKLYQIYDKLCKINTELFYKFPNEE